MARFPASLAANTGKCDLDAANYIRLPGTLDLLLALPRHRDRGKGILAVATTSH